MHKSLQQGWGHAQWLTALLFFTVIFTPWPDNIRNNWTKVSNSIFKNVLSSGPEGVSNSLSISISSIVGNLRQMLQFWDAVPSQAAPSDPNACSCLIISAVCHFSETATGTGALTKAWQLTWGSGNSVRFWNDLQMQMGSCRRTVYSQNENIVMEVSFMAAAWKLVYKKRQAIKRFFHVW